MKKANKKAALYVKIILLVSLIIFISVIMLITLSAKKTTVSDNCIYPKNSRGLTYGKAVDAHSIDELPDLVAAVGKHGIEGYIYKEDYLGDTVNDYQSYTLALSESELEYVRETYKDQYTDVSKVDFYKRCYDLPLYDETGENEIDKFTMQRGYHPYPSTIN